MMDMYILEIMRITLHSSEGYDQPQRKGKQKGQYKYFHRYQKALCQLGTHGQQTHEFYSLTILS